MAFCSKCGSAVADGASFCSACGAPVSTPGNPAVPPVAAVPAGAASAGVRSNVAAALCYVLCFITVIIFLVVDPYKNDRFVRFHAFQAIGFSIVALVLQIVWRMIVSIGFLSFGFLNAIFGLVGFVIWTAIVVYWVYLMYKAFNNETYMIPYIGEWAFKQAER
jgi:uncharacterized membrane protein